ncbi:MAG: hypothetical protein OHK0013_28840 [Sandaracinaceae bacterium]
MDDVAALETALGAELLRADLLGFPRPCLAERYRVERFLGRGATGLVVAAQDETLARPVALKLSLARADPQIGDEARALARLDHPNVVRLFDAVVTDAVLDGTAFRLWVISMQRVEGITMRTWLRETARTPEEIRRVLADAGRGLAAAHAARIVHRDFKPDNVLVRSDGVAQVIDFGFAVPQRSSVGEALVDVAGTAPYLAPEARSGRVTPRSDQFSFGITLVEALTGDTTPPGPSPPSGVPPQLWRVARRATQPLPEQRYPSMAALLADLRAEGSGRGTRSRIVLSALAVLTLLPLGVWQGHARYLDHRCQTLAGVWGFRTRVDEVSGPEAPPVGTEGIYALTLTPRGSCLFDVRLEQTGDDGPRGPHSYRRETRPSTPIRVDVSLFSSARLRVRRDGTTRTGRPFTILYDLSFLDEDTIEGTFEATDYRGHVPRVSRFDPVVGHDGQRP